MASSITSTEKSITDIEIVSASLSRSVMHLKHDESAESA
jgi:hypothetical protein